MCPFNKSINVMELLPAFLAVKRSIITEMESNPTA